MKGSFRTDGNHFIMVQNIAGTVFDYSLTLRRKRCISCPGRARTKSESEMLSKSFKKNYRTIRKGFEREVFQNPKQRNDLSKQEIFPSL